MLEHINKTYFVFATFCYALIGILFPVEMAALYVVNYLTVIVFVLFLQNLCEKPQAYFTSRKLTVLVFAYSACFVTCYNFISWYYTGNLYVFSVFDAMVYNNEATTMSEMSFMDGIDYFLKRYEAEDLGMTIALSFLYKIVSSKIMLSIFYTLLAVVTARAIFSISRQFMSVKYAFLCAIVYSFSSYVLWFHSSGLKESMLVTLITLFYSHYYRLFSARRSVSFVWMIAIALSLLLFRPVLAVFCGASLVLGVLLRRKLTAVQVFFIIAAMLGGIYFLETIMSSADRFLLGGTEAMLENKQMSGMVKGSVAFTYLVNILSSLFGPFPSVLSSKIHLSFFAPGLLFKLFISLAFWFGCIHIIKIRQHKAYPLLGFIILEMVSLTYILEGLELRKSIPHFPLVYIIAFSYIYRFDHNLLLTIKNHVFYKRSFHVLGFVLCALTLYWNFR